MQKIYNKFLVCSMALMVAAPAMQPNIVNAANKSYTYTMKSTVEGGAVEQTFTLPTDFKSVVSVATDNGKVGYKINGNNITLSAKDGAFASRKEYTDTQAESRTVTTSIYTRTGESPPATATYEDEDGFVASALAKSGGNLLASGGVVPGSTMSLEYQVKSDTDSFSNNYSYNENGYSGTLVKDGSSYSEVVDGYIGEPETKYVTGQPSQYYNSDGFSGELERYVVSGSPASSKTVTDYISSQNTSDLVDSMNYSANGYSGTLYKDGNYYVTHGSPAGTINYSRNNDYGDSAYESFYNFGAYCDNDPANTYRFKGAGEAYKEYTGYSGLVSDRSKDITIHFYDNNYWTPATGTVKLEKVYKPHNILESYISTCGYGTFVVPTGPSWQDANVMQNQRVTVELYWYGTLQKPDSRLYRQDYKGTVTTPNTQVYAYRGIVEKPGLDGRVYGYVQNYKGTVQENSIDDSVYRQDYAGTAYKSEIAYKDYVYNYKITVTYSDQASNCDYSNYTPVTTIKSNVLNSKCLTMNNGNDSSSTNLYRFSYDFGVTGISNSGR